jgi:hypothetical protein
MIILFFIILSFFNSIIFCQSVNNNSKYLEQDNSKKYHTNFSYLSSENQNTKILFRYKKNSSLIDYSNKFKDDMYFISYSVSNSINSKVNYSFSIFSENTKNTPVNNSVKYPYDSFMGISGDIQKGILRYNNNDFSFRVGRDNFLPGKYLNDRILFSSNNYPYDQLVFTFVKNKISISSFYLYLDKLLNQGNSFYRHLHGHRMNYIFDDGYIALSEICVYGSDNSSFHFPLLNPFTPFYLYQMNNSFSLNSIFSLEVLFEKNKNHIFLEFVLDDFQIEKKYPEDLEPTEFGILLDIRRYFNPFLSYNLNYTKVSNRTFNSPDNISEKMLYKNFPIGHHLGNNFWKFSNSISVEKNSHVLSIIFTYIERGEEALYSDFNTDYLNFSIEDGYQEHFPFGPIEIMEGVVVDYSYIFSENLFFNIGMAYWYKSFLDNDGFNFSISGEYSISI